MQGQEIIDSQENSRVLIHISKMVDMKVDALSYISREILQPTEWTAAYWSAMEALLLPLTAPYRNGRLTNTV